MKLTKSLNEIMELFHSISRSFEASRLADAGKLGEAKKVMFRGEKE